MGVSFLQTDIISWNSDFINRFFGICCIHSIVGKIFPLFPLELKYTRGNFKQDYIELKIYCKIHHKGEKI